MDIELIAMGKLAQAPISSKLINVSNWPLSGPGKQS